MFGIADDDKDRQIKSLQDQLAARDESLSDEAQARIAAEARVAAMALARDPAQIGALALGVASQIEDTFARGFDGGHFAEGWVGPVQMRRNALAGIIRDHIDMALLGAKREDS